MEVGARITRAAGENGEHDTCLQTCEGPSRRREARLVLHSAQGKTGVHSVKDGTSQNRREGFGRQLPATRATCTAAAGRRLLSGLAQRADHGSSGSEAGPGFQLSASLSVWSGLSQEQVSCSLFWRSFSLNVFQKLVTVHKIPPLQINTFRY